ncbi:MAG: peptidoglycan DD-metalloendopeptidase family protein [Raoultibacter sp.]
MDIEHEQRIVPRSAAVLLAMVFVVVLGFFAPAQAFAEAPAPIGAREALVVGVPEKSVPAPAAFGSQIWAWPLPSSNWIGQPFIEKEHSGIDIFANEGESIVAARPGIVAAVENSGDYLEDSGYGICVAIYHYDGTTSLYAHMSKRLVEKNQVVSQGQEIGKVGQTGWAYGNHLHFEVRTDTKPNWIWGHRVDPVPYLQGAHDPLSPGCYYDVNYSDPCCWYASSVKQATDLGLMYGRGNGLFAPDDTLTRGEVFTVLFRAATGTPGTIAGSNDTKFADNTPGQFYTGPINWAAGNALAQGDLSTGQWLVRPDDPISRQELAVIIHRYAAMQQGASTVDGSVLRQASDWEAIAPWALPALEWAAYHKIMNGKVCSDGSLLIDPNDTATRAQMAKIIVLTKQLVG